MLPIFSEEATDVLCITVVFLWLRYTRKTQLKDAQERKDFTEILTHEEYSKELKCVILEATPPIICALSREESERLLAYLDQSINTQEFCAVCEGWSIFDAITRRNFCIVNASGILIAPEIPTDLRISSFDLIPQEKRVEAIMRALQQRLLPMQKLLR